MLVLGSATERDSSAVAIVSQHSNPGVHCLKAALPRPCPLDKGTDAKVNVGVFGHRGHSPSFNCVWTETADPGGSEQN